MEGGFGRAFKSSVQPVELAHKLAKEMGDHKTVGVSNVYVPNEFDVYLGKDDYDHLVSFEDSLKTELSNYVTAFARREGWTLVAPPRIELHCDDDLRVGEFGIATRTMGAPAETPDGRRVRGSAPGSCRPRPLRRRAPSSTRPCCTRSRPCRAARGSAHLVGARRPAWPPGRLSAHGGGHRHRPQPALRHRPHRPERLAAARRDPQAGRRLHAARPRLHQRHARQSRATSSRSYCSTETASSSAPQNFCSRGSPDREAAGDHGAGLR